ncbi:hypothetical protein QYE76_003073 [Lolium multiflorum]|uniref:Uncharacterized protein n=1 Tax=Lolium multiflorum TaxID=4521 RepID=A0AAD8W0Y4_LOLMU|nr:hypothetical protein QYE76_003073 [Lolium multiflorum]
MGKKKISTLATGAASSSAAARSSPNPPKRSAHAPPLALAPPAPSNSAAGFVPGDWPASTTTKRDEKKAKSLGYIPSEEGNVILPAHPMWLYSGPKDETRINAAELSEKELLDEVRRLTHFSQEDSIPLTSSHVPFDADHPPTENPIDPDYLQDLPNDTSEKGDSSVPVGSHTEENASSEAERADPINPEAILIDPKSAANDISDTAGSMHDDDADHAAFVDAAAEEAEALASKRSSGGFADEDDLWDLDEDFIEPPPKKSKTGAAPSDLATSEVSAPATVPTAQISTASSLSKGKNIPSADAAATPPSGKPKEVKSSSSKLKGAIKIAAEARTEVDTLKEELKELKRKLTDEEAARLTAEAWAMEKDDLLR